MSVEFSTEDVKREFAPGNMNVSNIDTNDFHESESSSSNRSSAELVSETLDISTQAISCTNTLSSSNLENRNVEECQDISKLEPDSITTSELSDFEEPLVSVENDSFIDNAPNSKPKEQESETPTESKFLAGDTSMSEIESTPVSELTICGEPFPLTEGNFVNERVETLSSVEKSAIDSIQSLTENSLPTEYVETPSTKKPYSSLDLSNGIAEEIKEHLNQSLSKRESQIKCKKIMLALANNDKAYLASAARSPGGLLNDDIRRKVWPKLVNIDLVATSPRPSQHEIEQHPYYQQVLLDVNRSLKRFPPSIKEVQRLTMLDQLVILIMRVLCKHPELHYYQGYHDICVTFLLVLGEETAYYVLEKLSKTHLSVFMEKSMEPTIHILEHMYILIGNRDPNYQEFLARSEVGVGYCLSWLITWFSHVLNDYSTVVRFFDFFIVTHYWMPMYVTASLVLHRKPEVMKQDCDMASVHSFLCRIPDDLPFEDLLTESLDLFSSFKPKYLARKRPYVKAVKRRKVNRWEFIRRIKYMPATLVIAAAVLVTAVIYQAYKY